MQKIRAILVDDEESARDVLQNLLLRFCPDVELMVKCSTLPEAVEKIKELNPDLVFLDIEMPQYAGYEIARFFDQIEFEIVFVTAYDNYAIKAFEVAAIDYLLKPIDIERLKKSVERVQKKLGNNQVSQNIEVLKETLETKKVSNILVSDKGQQIIVALTEILAIEAQESYCLIHTQAKKYLVSKNLKHFETIFSENTDFIRVHKSWIINKKYIVNYSKSELTILLSSDLKAKLSKYKKAEFEQALLVS